MASLQVKKRQTGNESYETAKSTEHDDMVMSLAMPIWLSEQLNVQERIVEDQHERNAHPQADFDTYGGLDD